MIRLSFVLLGACGAAAPPTRTFETIAPNVCAAAMQERYGIDTSPEPRLCVPLYEAIASLGPEGAEVARGLTIVRDQRGRCGDECPDLASALMSDAMLASYRNSKHELHVTDATFEGPRWKSPPPSPEQVSAYLTALGLDWFALVTRLRSIPGANLPIGEIPSGDARVFDAIVRIGPRVLMGGEVSLVELMRHELGHAIQLHGALMFQIRGWSALTGWVETSDGDVADGFVGGAYANEDPIVASRLVLGLPRGKSSYRPAPSGPPTGYAQFDPMEDYGESTRLAQSDPRALAKTSPVRLLLAGTTDSLRDPEVRKTIVPALRTMLASEHAVYAMRAIQRLGTALLPEAAALADPRPLPFPGDTTAGERDDLTKAALVVTVGKYEFRPTDAAFLAIHEKLRADNKELEDFNRGLSAP